MPTIPVNGESGGGVITTDSSGNSSGNSSPISTNSPLSEQLAKSDEKSKEQDVVRNTPKRQQHQFRIDSTSSSSSTSSSAKPDENSGNNSSDDCDEVKVYNDEGAAEEEQRNSENLSEEKTEIVQENLEVRLNQIIFTYMYYVYKRIACFIYRKNGLKCGKYFLMHVLEYLVEYMHDSEFDLY